MKRISFFLVFVILVSSNAWAGPIYVYRESDGTKRFTTKKPPSSFDAEVYSASGKFSRYKGNGVRYSISPASVYSYSRIRPLNNKKFDQIIASASVKHGLAQNLIKAVIHAESGFNPHAVSPKGALGLMQLMPFNLRTYGVKDPYSPEQNINGGTKMLSRLLNQYSGNISLALAAYNAGEGAVQKYRGVPPFAETVNYVRKVLRLKAMY